MNQFINIISEKSELNSPAHILYQEYFKIINETPQQLIHPDLIAEIVEGVAHDVLPLLQAEPSLLQIDSPIVIVGDLHGHLYDLYRVLAHFGMPPAKKYLFLGDLVDRGDCSIQTVSLIFAMKVLYPKNIYILRGNHEFRDISMKSGFYSDIKVMYSSEQMFDAYIEAFQHLPLAALISNTIFCVHGGIGPELKDISQISRIKKPSFAGSEDLINAILWSDPSSNIDTFAPSKRGTGYMYGEEATNKFLEDNRLKYLIRAHECVNEGIRFSCNSRLITVFSASNYCGCQDNVGGALELDENSVFSYYTYSVEQDIEKGIVIKHEIAHEKKKFCFKRSSFIQHKSSLPRGRPYSVKSAIKTKNDIPENPNNSSKSFIKMKPPQAFSLGSCFVFRHEHTILGPGGGLPKGTSIEYTKYAPPSSIS